MWCSRFRNQISAFVDGELSGVEARTVAEHIQLCPSCAQERDTLAGLARMASLIPEEELPSDLHARIMNRLAYADAVPAVRTPAPRRSAPFGPLIWTAMAGATATVAFAFVQGQTGVVPSRPEHTSSVAAGRAPEGASPVLAPSSTSAAGQPVPAGQIVPSEPTSVPASIQEPRPVLSAAPIAAKPVPGSVRSELLTSTPSLSRESRPQPLSVTTTTGKPSMEPRGSEPVAPSGGLQNPEILPLPGDAEFAVGAPQPGSPEPVIAIEKEPVMRMAGTMPIEEQIDGDEDEGLRSLRMFFDERNRSVPQPPALPKRNRKPL